MASLPFLRLPLKNTYISISCKAFFFMHVVSLKYILISVCYTKKKRKPKFNNISLFWIFDKKKSNLGNIIIIILTLLLYFFKSSESHYGVGGIEAVLCGKALMRDTAIKERIFFCSFPNLCKSSLHVIVYYCPMQEWFACDYLVTTNLCKSSLHVIVW